MEEYRQWLEQQIERCLNDKDLQREHWAFCKAYEKFTALRQPDVSGRSEQLVNFLLHLNDKELINNHDFDYEKEAKKYLKKLTNCH